METKRIGRPQKEGDYIAMTIRISVSTADKIGSHCREKGMIKSALIDRLIQQYFKDEAKI